MSIRMLERCLFLKHFWVEGSQTALEPFSVSFLLVSCSHLSPGLHTESQNLLNIMAKQLNEGRNTVCVWKLASLHLAEQSH